jgi:hypothetical protein
MGLFGKIKDAIFGHPKAQEQARQAQPASTPPAPGQSTPAMPQMQTPQSAPVTAPAKPIDVDAVLTEMAEEKGRTNLNWRSSIVDLLKLLDIDPSLANREELATEFGYTGEKGGSAEMNIWLHKKVMEQLRGSPAPA